MIVYLNGRFVDESEANVSVFDHGLLYGDGVFEEIRSYNGKIFRLNEHLNRFYESARLINLKMPLTKPQFKEAIILTCRKNNIVDGYIHTVVTRGIGDLGLDPRKCRTSTYFIIVKPFDGLYGNRYSEGLKAIISKTRRLHPASLNPKIKSLNYLNNILAKIEANMVKADDAIMLDYRNYPTEATAENLFIVKKSIVYTPPTETNLPGITRGVVIELCKREKIKIIESYFTLTQLKNADEVFLTGTAVEIAPIVKIDNKVIGNGKVGPITSKLMALFRKETETTGTPIKK